MAASSHSSRAVKNDAMAFMNLGDQFIALQKGRRQAADDGRHFGLVVDDKEAAREALKAAGVTLLDGLDFRDPWGDRVEIVGYDNVQFTKAPNVLRGVGLMHLAKNDKAKKELAKKGMTGGVGPHQHLEGVHLVTLLGRHCHERPVSEHICHFTIYSAVPAKPRFT